MRTYSSACGSLDVKEEGMFDRLGYLYVWFCAMFYNDCSTERAVVAVIRAVSWSLSSILVFKCVYTEENENELSLRVALLMYKTIWISSYNYSYIWILFSLSGLSLVSFCWFMKILFEMQDQYILHSAEAQNINLPFACRHGTVFLTRFSWLLRPS